MKLPDKHQALYGMIFDEDDIKWQSVIYELVRNGKVDPWDVDISLFSREYLRMISKMKEHNFRISGKVVLAAAILLKLKTNRLGLQEFLGMLEEPTEFVENEEGIEDFQFVDDEEQKLRKLSEHMRRNKKYKVEARLDAKRERKVTVFELVSALKKALEVDERRDLKRAEIPREEAPEFKVNRIDIFSKIRAVYDQLVMFLKRTNSRKVEFYDIVPSREKKDVIWTFVPLLHLANQGQIELRQDEPFGKLYVYVNKKDLNLEKMKGGKGFVDEGRSK